MFVFSRMMGMAEIREVPMKRWLPAGILVAILAVACGGSGSNAIQPVSGPITPAATASILAVQGEPDPDVHPIGWYATVHVIDADTRARMKYSWRRGCPVPLKNLRLITMSYVGFDREAHLGEMVVHKSVAGDVVKVFRRLYRAKYPIRRMRLVDAYKGSDDKSMAADNTSAFNCRKVTGGSEWSQHSYGWAIDINPVENPYVSRSGKVLPPAGRKYADRRSRARGVIHRGDVVWRAFRSIGWGWGGSWRSIKDYQHFSLTGR